MNYYIINCPHCDQIIQVFKHELNCKIFRHGIYKDSLEQIDPHLPKEKCEQLSKNNLIYGCSKPFQIIFENKKIVVEKCDYI